MGVRDTRGDLPSVKFDLLRVHFVDIPRDPEMDRKNKGIETLLLAFTKLSTRGASA